MEQKDPIKKIPHGISKLRLRKLYATVPEHILTDAVNHIILDHRRKIKRYDNLSDIEIIRTNTVYYPEFVELTKEFGVPAGYEI